jgi:hypothetical protein
MANPPDSLKGSSRYGMNASVNMGPSNLLKASGTNNMIPRMGDYHKNLTKKFGYVPTGPG